MYSYNPYYEKYLAHYGVKHKSGRYPWGSGDRPYQGDGFFTKKRSNAKIGKIQVVNEGKSVLDDIKSGAKKGAAIAGSVALSLVLGNLGRDIYKKLNTPVSEVQDKVNTFTFKNGKTIMEHVETENILVEDIEVEGIKVKPANVTSWDNNTTYWDEVLYNSKKNKYPNY